MRASAHVLVVALLLACAESDRAGPPGGLAVPGDARAGDALPAVLAASTCVSETELMAQQYPYPLCNAVLPFGEPRTFVDLSATDTARCDNWEYGLDNPNYAHVLPNDPSLYPLVVRVSKRGFTGACDACNEPANTAYGVAFRAPSEVLRQPSPAGYRDYRLLVRAPAPWFAVAGGTGEADPYPCLGGYQEFFEPRPCLQTHSIGYGIVTADPDAPDADIWVDLLPEEFLAQEPPDHAGCCPYRCDD